MKFSIFLCALGMLLVCKETLCIDFPARLEGNCKPEDVEPFLLADCSNIRCHKAKDGNISTGVIGCGLIYCPHGYSKNFRLDLTKKYPDCCPKCLSASNN